MQCFFSDGVKFPSMFILTFVFIIKCFVLGFDMYSREKAMSRFENLMIPGQLLGGLSLDSAGET